jgi:hypothetical protein
MAADTSTPRTRWLIRLTAAVAPAAIIGGIVAGNVIARSDAQTATSNSTLMSGQVGCSSPARRAVGVSGMTFQTGNGQIVTADLAPITNPSGMKTNWDHYEANVPASTGGAYTYVARVTCGHEADWTVRIAGAASRTIACGVVDGECSDTVMTPGSAHWPSFFPPESPHTPEPTDSDTPEPADRAEAPSPRASQNR